MLLFGPTGAGTSFLARRIYELRRQRQQLSGRFVEVNCATRRGDAAMSALFGHVRGAFAGAQNKRPGLLKTAAGGLLFLDEIGELGRDEQAMRLKAIEEKRFLPLGCDREVSRDFQLIAGTNRDLRRAVADGRFRADLHARINLWTFTLPGLSERSEDIEPNLDFELKRHARENGRQVRFNAEARQRFLAFACSPAARWRGNFRELSAAVTRLATLADSGQITEADVDEEITRLRRAWADNDPDDCLATGPTHSISSTAACSIWCLMSAAGRQLFAMSHFQKSQTNDADRLRKFFARFAVDRAAATASRQPYKY